MVPDQQVCLHCQMAVQDLELTQTIRETQLIQVELYPWELYYLPSDDNCDLKVKWTWDRLLAKTNLEWHRKADNNELEEHL